MQKPTYNPIVKVPISDLVKMWLETWQWGNGDKVKVFDSAFEVSHNANNVFIMPICEPPTDEQLKK